MGSSVVRGRIVYASVFAIVVACGGRYGTTETDPGEVVDASVDDASGRDASAPSEAEDGSFADAAHDANATDGGVGSGDVGAACIRLATPLTRVPAAHVVSVYEGIKGDGGVYGVNVKVVEKDTVLVLSSFRAEQWRISFEGTGSLAHVFIRVVDGTATTYELLGVPNGVPVTAKASTSFSYGYSRGKNNGNGDYFDKQMPAIRDDIGGLETTYQGVYAGGSFTVGGALPSGLSGIESYDTRVACSDPCTRTGTIKKWVNAAGYGATITNLSAVGENNGAELRADDGARCGKHYFEIQTPTAATVAVTSPPDYLPLDLGFTPNSTNVPAGTRIGVAIDLDANTVIYTTQTGSAPATTLPAKPLGLWYREAVGPAYSTNAKGTVTMITRAPFVLTVPAGYAADM